MTVVMGYAAVIWFERGKRLSNESIQQISKQLTKVFAENLKAMLKRKPGKRGLKEAIETMLSNSKFGHDRSELDKQSQEILLLTQPEDIPKPE